MACDRRDEKRSFLHPFFLNGFRFFNGQQPIQLCNDNLAMVHLIANSQFTTKNFSLSLSFGSLSASTCALS